MWTNWMRLAMPWPFGRRGQPGAGTHGDRTSWRVGQAMVEFALTSLIFLPIILGTIEIGRGVWYYNQLSQLSREGVRWLIVTTADGATNWQATGNAPATSQTYVVSTCNCPNSAVDWIRRKDIGIPHDQLTVTITRGAIAGGSNPFTWGIPVTVELTYPYRPLLASMLNIPATITLRAATTMHFQ